MNFIPRENSVEIGNWQVEHLKIFESFAEIYKNGDDQTKKLLKGSLSQITHDEKLGLITTSNKCVAGYKGLLYILPDGNAYTCPNVVYVEDKLGNIFVNSLQEIVHNTFTLHENLKSFSGLYQCAGERKLYLNNNDFIRLNFLEEFSKLFIRDSDSTENLSFCYNRNF